MIILKASFEIIFTVLIFWAIAETVYHWIYGARGNKKDFVDSMKN